MALWVRLPAPDLAADNIFRLLTSEALTCHAHARARVLCCRQELQQSQSQQASSLSSDLLDRLIVERLIESPPATYPQAPVHYLIACYTRACVEQRSKGVAESQALLETVAACKELIMSYAMLCLQGVVQQVRQRAWACSGHSSHGPAVGCRQSWALHKCRNFWVDRADGKGPPHSALLCSTHNLQGHALSVLGSGSHDFLNTACMAQCRCERTCATTVI